MATSPPIESGEANSNKGRHRRAQYPARTFNDLHWKLENLSDELTELTTQVHRFNELFTQETYPATALSQLPKELPQTWLRLVLLAVWCGGEAFQYRDNLRACNVLLRKSIRKLQQICSKSNLLDHSVVQPLDLASLVHNRFIRDLTGSQPDTVQTYAAYLSNLVSQATALLTET